MEAVWSSHIGLHGKERRDGAENQAPIVSRSKKVDIFGAVKASGVECGQRCRGGGLTGSRPPPQTSPQLLLGTGNGGISFYLGLSFDLDETSFNGPSEWTTLEGGRQDVIIFGG